MKCLPPQNKPAPAEVRQCNGYLAADLAACRPAARSSRWAASRTRRCCGRWAAAPPTSRSRTAGVHALPGDRALFDSYHCSRYNTNTRRLTPAMFEAVFAAIAAHLRDGGRRRQRPRVRVAAESAQPR